MKSEVIIDVRDNDEAMLITALLHTYLKERTGLHRDFRWRDKEL